MALGVDFAAQPAFRGAPMTNRRSACIFTHRRTSGSDACCGRAVASIITPFQHATIGSRSGHRTTLVTQSFAKRRSTR